MLTVVGNLTADPDLRFTTNGAAVASFTIASAPRTYDRANGQWQDGETLFLRCVAWRALAEQITESLSKGTRALAYGRLRQREYEDKDGIKRTVVELEVEEIGPSLKHATVTVTKAARSTPAHPASTPDAWQTPAPSSPGTAAGADQPPL